MNFTQIPQALLETADRVVVKGRAQYDDGATIKCQALYELQKFTADALWRQTQPVEAVAAADRAVNRLVLWSRLGAAGAAESGFLDYDEAYMAFLALVKPPHQPDMVVLCSHIPPRAGPLLPLACRAACRLLAR